jgi:hypothetical protein
MLIDVARAEEPLGDPTTARDDTVLDLSVGYDLAVSTRPRCGL